MLKTYQKESNLFKLSQDTNREKLKIKKKTTSLCNGFVAVTSLQWFSLLTLIYAYKATIFLGDGLYWKLLTRRKGLLNQ